MSRDGVAPASVCADSVHGMGGSVGVLRVADTLFLAYVMSIIQTKVNAPETCW